MGVALKKMQGTEGQEETTEKQPYFQANKRF
ncbi:MAG: hypothetical protein H6Q68_3513 [Firmicutes bacterium]|nr:hypothetical protein [Bacillota bacterium]